MLKFKNRETKTGKELLYQISMSSVQGGIDVEVDEIQVEPEMKNIRQRTLLLTPMDAAAFVHHTRVTNGLSCRQVGHGTSLGGSGMTLFVQKLANGGLTGMEFIGDVAEVSLNIAGVSMVVPTFVIDAMRLAVEQMMESLFFMSTGEMEEEFS